MCIRVGLVVCPTVMMKQGWTQPRSLELHKWIHFLRDNAAQSSNFPVRVDCTEHRSLLQEVADIRQYAVHRCSRSLQAIRASLGAAHAFAQLHQDDIARDAILQLIEIVDEVLPDISSQQELLKKDLKSQIETMLAQQKNLVRQAHGSVVRQNQATLTQLGERITRLSRVSNQSHAALNSRLSSEEYHDPSDVDEIEAALIEADRTAISTESSECTTRLRRECTVGSVHASSIDCLDTTPRREKAGASAQEHFTL